MGFLGTILMILAAVIFGMLIIRILPFDSKIKSKSSLSPGSLQDIAKQLDHRVILKLLSHFDSNFKNIDRPLWRVANEGIVVKFIKDETPHFVYYTPHGEWKHTLRSYNGEALPMAVSKLVYAKFRHYAISRTEEIVFSDSESRTYIVHLCKGNKFKEVFIDNDQIMVMNESEL